MKIFRMIVRLFRVLMGKWHYQRYLHYAEIICKEQEAALKVETR